jgi:hypothetical protein
LATAAGAALGLISLVADDESVGTALIFLFYGWLLGVLFLPAILLLLGVVELAARGGASRPVLRGIAMALATGLGIALAIGIDEPILVVLLIGAGVAYGALLQLPPGPAPRDPAADTAE